jgi:hypothetical protein
MPCKVLNHSFQPERKVDYSSLTAWVLIRSFWSLSPKAIPQMVDTADVLASIGLSQTTSRLLAIIANRGAELTSQHTAIQYLGFPFLFLKIFR